MGKYAAIIKTPGRILARGLEIMCAKDGRYIFINKKVMVISGRHDFFGKIYEFHWKIFVCPFRHKGHTTLTPDVGKSMRFIILFFCGVIYMSWISKTSLGFSLV